MASGKAGGASALFSEATKAEQLDSHTYRVNLNKGFCIGAGISPLSFPVSLSLSIYYLNKNKNRPML